MGIFAGLSAIYDWGQGWIWCQPGDEFGRSGFFVRQPFWNIVGNVLFGKTCFQQKTEKIVPADIKSIWVSWSSTHQPLNKSPERNTKTSRRQRDLTNQKPTTNFLKFGESKGHFEQAGPYQSHVGLVFVCIDLDLFKVMFYRFYHGIPHHKRHHLRESMFESGNLVNWIWSTPPTNMIQQWQMNVFWGWDYLHTFKIQAGYIPSVKHHLVSYLQYQRPFYPPIIEGYLNNLLKASLRWPSETGNTPSVSPQKKAVISVEFGGAVSGPLQFLPPTQKQTYIPVRYKPVAYQV